LRTEVQCVSRATGAAVAYPSVAAILEVRITVLLGRWTSAAFVSLASLAALLPTSALKTIYAFVAASGARRAVHVRAARQTRKRGDQLLRRFATGRKDVVGIRTQIRIVSRETSPVTGYGAQCDFGPGCVSVDVLRAMYGSGSRVGTGTSEPRRSRKE
jgi:hypothetical protein